MPYLLLAEFVLIVHFMVVLFLVGGLVAVVAGNALHWRWVNAWHFRLLHLGAMALVVLQAWLGRYCALTTLESWLRARAGSAGYATSFMQHWLQRLIYVEAPFWVFAVGYTVFGALVLLAWRRYPPVRRPNRALRA